jgi:hypothetical protein
MELDKGFDDKFRNFMVNLKRSKIIQILHEQSPNYLLLSQRISNSRWHLCQSVGHGITWDHSEILFTILILRASDPNIYHGHLWCKRYVLNTGLVN